MKQFILQLFIGLAFTMATQSMLAQTIVPYLKKNGKYIIVDSATMKPLNANEYASAKPLSNGLCTVSETTFGKESLMNNRGQLIVPGVYRTIADLDEGVMGIWNDDSRIGIMDTSGKLLMEPKYFTSIRQFHNGFAMGSDASNYWGIINKQGKNVLNVWYQEANDFHQGIAKVKTVKYGFIDTLGKQVMPFDYALTSDTISEGFISVYSGDKACLVNTNGKEMFAFTNYEWIGPVKNGIAVVMLEHKYGFIDTLGKLIAPIIYPYYQGDFSQPFVMVQRDGRKGYIDRTGKEVIPVECLSATSFSEGMAALEKKVMGKYEWKLLDATGNEHLITPDDITNIEPFSNGVAVYNCNGKLGLINRDGISVMKPKYDKIYPFVDGVARVEINYMGGYIDTKGKELMPPKYSWTLDFKNGWGTAMLDGHNFYVDKKGRQYRD